MCMFRYSLTVHCFVIIIVILATGQISSNAAATDVKDYRRFLYSKSNYIRLQHGRTHTDGIVEILHNGQWGRICDFGWDSNEASVTCRMLGLSTNHAQYYSFQHHHNHYGHSYNGPTYQIHGCRGTESDLTHCPLISWYNQNNNNYHCNTVGVRCHEVMPATTKITTVAPTPAPTKATTTTTLSTSTKASTTTTTTTTAPTQAIIPSSTPLVKQSTTVYNAPTTPVVVHNYSIKDCRDTRQDCSSYAKYCNLFGTWEIHDCPVTCGFCKPTSTVSTTTSTLQSQSAKWVTIPNHSKWVTIPSSG